MTDVNEQSFSAGSTNDTTGRLGKPPRQRLTTAGWRFRPAPSAVVQTLRTQIIPRIVLALRTLPAVKSPPPTAPGSIEEFAALAAGHDDAAASAYVEKLQASGASVESILLDLLAPAARHLGTLWETDAADFATVTLGVSRLQRIMRQLGEAFFGEGQRGEGGESVLLTIIPGEQHSFGLSMVAEFFRRAGWNLCTGPFASHQELTSLVQHHWFDVVGFSVSSDRRLDELKKDISDIRRDSRNRHVGIMLGGPMMIAQPGLVATMGADMMSVDAATAPQQARGLIDQLTHNA
ncbi:MAG: cobalamin-dependent protein [Tardiphaga sp.]